MTLDYLTDEFIRRDCGVHGAEFSDEDCQRIREEVFTLYNKGEFYHTGVYWIANRLAKESRNSATISFKENLKMTVTFLFRELRSKPTQEWTPERLRLLPVVELSDLCQERRYSAFWDKTGVARATGRRN